jgi:hypothetical protein
VEEPQGLVASWRPMTVRRFLWLVLSVICFVNNPLNSGDGSLLCGILLNVWQTKLCYFDVQKWFAILCSICHCRLVVSVVVAINIHLRRLLTHSVLNCGIVSSDVVLGFLIKSVLIINSKRFSVLLCQRGESVYVWVQNFGKCWCNFSWFLLWYLQVACILWLVLWNPSGQFWFYIYLGSSLLGHATVTSREVILVMLTRSLLFSFQFENFETQKLQVKAF